MASLESYLSKYKEGLKLARQKVVELQKEKEALQGELTKAAEKASKVIIMFSVCHQTSLLFQSNKDMLLNYAFM